MFHPFSLDYFSVYIAHKIGRLIQAIVQGNSLFSVMGLVNSMPEIEASGLGVTSGWFVAYSEISFFHLGLYASLEWFVTCREIFFT